MKQDVVDGAIDIDGRFTDVTLSISTTRLSGVCILLYTIHQSMKTAINVAQTRLRYRTPQHV